MDSGAPRFSPRLAAALAGFQAGTVAVFVMLAWLGLASAWYGRTVWTAPSLFASLFYGDNAIGRGFSWSTLSGVAVFVIMYSLYGALFGAAIGGGLPRFRVVLIGILAGAAWYYLWFGLIWKHVQPLIPIYAHDRPMMWGHMIYGAMLGRFPIYLRRLTRPVSPPLLMRPAEPEPPPAPVTEPPPPEPSPEPNIRTSDPL